VTGEVKYRVLTSLQLIAWVAALAPPPVRHRHRYYGVLAPDASEQSLRVGRCRDSALSGGNFVAVGCKLERQIHLITNLVDKPDIDLDK
jgi:Putative transposase